MMFMTTSSAFAKIIGEVNYRLNSSKTATVVSTTSKYPVSIVIPEKVKGDDGVEYTVVGLEDKCFYDCFNLTSITLPSTITTMGFSCFEDCKKLTSITLPSSLTTLGDRCFYGCSGLTSIEIPANVTSIGFLCFYNCKALKSVFFKGKVPISIKSASIPTESIIYVPKDYFQDYKDALGSNYQIYIWNTEETGADDNPAAQCETPIVSYESGNLKFTCETSGVKYYYTISDYDIATNKLSEDGNVSLSAAYNILVYATADGYRDSKIAKATLYWLEGNQDNPSNINLSKTRGIIASAHDGIVSISGLNNGEEVKFYSADGKYLGTTVAVNGAASYAVSESMVIAKVGNNSIKIAMQ